MNEHQTQPDSSSDSPRPRFVPLPARHDPGVPAEEAAQRFAEFLRTRRTVRTFSDRAVSRKTIEWIIKAAACAPSGAHKQPWRFVCVQNPALKREIRVAAEAEERAFYARRATPEWLADLAPLGTDPDKSFLEIAPWLIVVFKLAKGDDGAMVYYPSESVGIACGLLIAAIHHAGLVCVTHTPSPMGFLKETLRRPDNERAYLLIPVGYPAEDCTVPEVALARKPIEDIMVIDRGGTP